MNFLWQIKRVISTATENNGEKIKLNFNWMFKWTIYLTELLLHICVTFRKNKIQLSQVKVSIEFTTYKRAKEKKNLENGNISVSNRLLFDCIFLRKSTKKVINKMDHYYCNMIMLYLYCVARAQCPSERLNKIMNCTNSVSNEFFV